MQRSSEVADVQPMTNDLAGEAFHVVDGDIDWPIATAGMLATATPLFVGLATGNAHLGLFAALGGMNVALAMPGAKVSDRWIWGVLALVGSTAAVALGVLTQPSVVACVAATFIWIALWSTLRVAGKHGALTGFVVSAVFVVTNGISSAPLEQEVACLAVGGAFGLIVMVLAVLGSKPVETETTWPGLSTTLSQARSGLLDDQSLRHHALRIGLTTALAVLAYRLIDLPYGYWVALTALAILQPGAHTSRVRALQRGSGSFIGILTATVVVLVTANPWWLAAATALTAFSLFGLRERNYHWLVMLLTPTVLLMISTTNYSELSICAYRILNTALGIALALVATFFVWGETPKSKLGSRSP